MKTFDQIQLNTCIEILLVMAEAIKKYEPNAIETIVYYENILGEIPRDIDEFNNYINGRYVKFSFENKNIKG